MIINGAFRKWRIPQKTGWFKMGKSHYHEWELGAPPILGHLQIATYIHDTHFTRSAIPGSPWSPVPLVASRICSAPRPQMRLLLTFKLVRDDLRPWPNYRCNGSCLELRNVVFLRDSPYHFIEIPICLKASCFTEIPRWSWNPSWFINVLSIFKIKILNH